MRLAELFPVIGMGNRGLLNTPAYDGSRRTPPNTARTLKNFRRIIEPNGIATILRRSVAFAFADR